MGLLKQWALASVAAAPLLMNAAAEAQTETETETPPPALPVCDTSVDMITPHEIVIRLLNTDVAQWDLRLLGSLQPNQIEAVEDALPKIALPASTKAEQEIMRESAKSSDKSRDAAGVASVRTYQAGGAVLYQAAAIEQTLENYRRVPGPHCTPG